MGKRLDKKRGVGMTGGRNVGLEGQEGDTQGDDLN